MVVPVRRSGFVEGVAMLGAAGLLAKLIGALYRIPIANVLGAEGSGYYGMVYPVYSVLAAVSSVGIPTAISQLVAKNVGADNVASAAHVFHAARRGLLLIGAGTAAAVFLLAGPLSALIRERPATDAFRAISPAFALVCIISCYRGVLQGCQNMTPTAVSQVLEQVGKLGFSLTGTWAVMGAGGSPSAGAAAALGGIACAEALSAGYLACAYRKSDAAELLRNAPHCLRSDEWRALRTVITTAVPVTVGACILPLVFTADALIDASALQRVGEDARTAAAEVGLLSMNVEPLVNLPTALSSAIAISIVPALALASARENEEERVEKTQIAAKTSIWIGLPCAAGLALFARPIIALLFGGLSSAEQHTAGMLLRIMSISVFFLTFIQTATGILQGVGRHLLPIAALCIGLGIKVFATIALVQYAGILGAAWATVLCFGAMAAVDVWFVRRHASYPLDVRSQLLGPVAATILLAAAAWGVYSALRAFQEHFALILAVLTGGVVYLFALCRLGCVQPCDMALLPGGARLARHGRRIGLWKEEK